MSMSTEASNAATNGGLVSELVESYRQLPMRTERYLLFYIFPAVVFFVATVVIAFQGLLPWLGAAMLPLLGILVLCSAVAYPKIERDQRRIGLENQFHLAVTHMTVMSVTNIDRMEVMRTIAQEEEYGEFAREMQRIVELVDGWNQSLDDAFRRRAKAVPSEPVSDFFERMAYTLNAGQELDDFLVQEQSVMLEQYETVYESSLGNLDVLKDIYLSMVLSMTFALVFAVVLPILTGTNPTLTVAIVLVIFVFVQIGFYVAIRSMVPYDPIWFLPSDITASSEFRLKLSMVAGAGLSILILLAAGAQKLGIAPSLPFISIGELPLALYFALPITPLLIPGIMFHIEEGRIKRRDKEFPSFIRALGSVESAKQSTTLEVLSTLRRKDFGPLTEDINNLYKRLNMRINSELAWRYFAVDANSYLIQKFSEMYLVARKMGGQPRQLGDLIGRNMNVVNQLRERRRQSTITLIGILYGITAASTFAFFIALEIVKLLAGIDVSTSGPQGSGMAFDEFIHTGAYNIDVIELLLYGVLLFNALISSVLIRTTDGGHQANAYLHFVTLVWLSSLTAIITTRLVGSFLNV